MSQLIKNILLKVATHYSKNRFTGIEVDKNPFGESVNANESK